MARTVKVNRRYQFRHKDIFCHNKAEIKTVDWCTLLDPQHAGRQGCIDAACYVNDLREKSGLDPALSVWQYRGYHCYLPPTEWNPFNEEIVGPHWGDDGMPSMPGSSETAHEDKYSESLDWFLGYMRAIGFDCHTSDHPHLSPYINHYIFKGWAGMPPMSWRPRSYYMQWGDRTWRDRLATHHSSFAKWVDNKINGPQAIMLGTLKRQQVWPEEVKRERMYEFASENYTAPHPAAPVTWWMREHGYNPATDVSINSKRYWGGNHHYMFPRTNEVEWWYGVCSLPGKIRWRLDRAGLKKWKVVCDFGSQNAWNGYEYINQYYIQDRDQSIDFIWQNAVKAAANCDIIIWPEHEDEWYLERRPWVLEMKKAMAERCELVREDSF